MKLRNTKNKKLVKLASKFQPWDFQYLLDLEKQAMKQMQEYHKNSNITYDNPKIARQIQLAIKLLNIADETDFAYRSSGGLLEDNGKEYKDWMTVYVNTNNWKRFFNNINYENIDWNKPCFQSALRTQKAWYLYNKLRYYYALGWWD